MKAYILAVSLSFIYPQLFAQEKKWSPYFGAGFSFNNGAFPKNQQSSALLGISYKRQFSLHFTSGYNYMDKSISHVLKNDITYWTSGMGLKVRLSKPEKILSSSFLLNADFGYDYKGPNVFVFESDIYPEDTEDRVLHRFNKMEHSFSFQYGLDLLYKRFDFSLAGGLIYGKADVTGCSFKFGRIIVSTSLTFYLFN